MTDVYIDIRALTFNVEINHLQAAEQILRHPLFHAANVKAVLHEAAWDVKKPENIAIDKIELDLGTFSLSDFSSHFNPRLRQAFAASLFKLNSGAGEKQQGAARENVALAEAEEPALALIQLARSCLDSADVQSLSESAGWQQAVARSHQRQQLLRRLLDETVTKGRLPESYSARITRSRLAMAALHYLLMQTQGRHWLSEHAPTLTQLNVWATAISSGEVDTDRVVQMFVGQPRAAVMSPASVYSDSIIQRWLLPLWQHKAVRRQVQQRAGKDAVAHINHRLNIDNRRRAGKSPHNTPCQTGGRKTAEVIQLIANAGVVVIWPLLPQLFSLLALTEDAQFISDAARWQAVLTLDYLAWAMDSTDPDRLLLSQLLCAIAPDAALPPETGLSIAQQHQIDAWLTAVGQQLPAWKKFSLTDIRQLFLQRPGEIITQTEPPQIVVKSESFDLLLGDWPWPLTLVQLPWLEQPFTLIWPVNGQQG